MHVLFEDRFEAGRRMAKILLHLRGLEPIIMAIPRGGAPVAAAAAARLGLQWNVIVVRKLPIPWNPEAGFGAMADDGSIVLNEPMLHGLRMGKEQIDEVARDVREEIARRLETYSRARPPVDVARRTVVVLDDGLASGYTMLAAIKSLRARSASRVIAASPVASAAAAAMVGEAADECVFEIVSPAVPFAVADFYVEWHDLTDEDILPILGEG